MKAGIMEKIMITIPNSLIHEIDLAAKNRSEFIRESVKQRLKREKEQLMTEGYKKEKNPTEWEMATGDGIE